jgi:hypothetical protein
MVSLFCLIFLCESNIRAVKFVIENRLKTESVFRDLQKSIQRDDKSFIYK